LAHTAPKTKDWPEESAGVTDAREGGAPDTRVTAIDWPKAPAEVLGLRARVETRRMSGRRCKSATPVQIATLRRQDDPAPYGALWKREFGSSLLLMTS